MKLQQQKKEELKNTILQQKKEELKNIVLNGMFDYDMITYRLIESTCLDSIITKIDDTPVPCDVKPNEITSANEHFIQLLDRFIQHFRTTFPNMHLCIKYSIESLIKSNHDDMEKYLLSKHYLGDNKYIDFYKYNINKIFISNFIKNADFLPQIEMLIDKEELKIKDINSYDLEEVLRIKNILKNIVLCNNHEFNIFHLFTNMRYELNYHKKNNTVDTSLQLYNAWYDSMLDNYYKKKPYLKYFI